MEETVNFLLIPNTESIFLGLKIASTTASNLRLCYPFISKSYDEYSSIEKWLRQV